MPGYYVIQNLINLIHPCYSSTYFLSLFNFADDIVLGGNGRKRAAFKNWSDALFINLDQDGCARSPLLVG